jgi:DNA-binding response OmpR family regulator
MSDAGSDHDAATNSSTVLVVEDETELADLYAAWLADTYDVRTAYGGEAALEQLDAAVDVVLLDRRMPDLSGDDVVAEIRKQAVDCRVVIVSAVNPDFDVIGMGFDDYLTKPVDEDDLHDAVARMLTRAEYNETLQEYQQLVATRAALDAQKSDAELRQSDEYATLQEQIAEVEAAAEETVEEFTDADFEAAFRDLDRETGDTPTDSTPSTRDEDPT